MAGQAAEAAPRGNYQLPKAKDQGTPNAQLPRTSQTQVGFWRLGVGSALEVGLWKLVVDVWSVGARLSRPAPAINVSLNFGGGYAV